MSINDKIKQILIERNFTPSYFADEIGVQRSSISHILSGRNRPSFDIIQKIIRRFPDLGYEWIMEEDQYSQPVNNRYNNTPAPVSANTPGNTLVNTVNTQRPTSTSAVSSFRSNRNEILPDEPDQNRLVNDEPLATRKVERILMFYSDGSFQEYLPV